MTTPPIDLTIQTALVDLIYPLFVTPRGTLSATGTAGATSIDVDPADANQFAEGGLVTFRDELGEPTIPIVDVDLVSGQLTLDFTGSGHSGLLFTHTAGTEVSTNLFDRMPWIVSPMLRAGPVVWATTLKHETAIATQGRRTWEVLTEIIHYHRRLGRVATADGSAQDWNEWVMLIEGSARSDLDAIAHALLADQHLGGHAQKLGRPDSAGPLFSVDWSRQQVDQDAWEIQAEIQLVVTAIGRY